MLKKEVALTEIGVVTNTAKVTDTAILEVSVAATDEVTLKVVERPASCEDGRPTALVFEYTGDDCDATTNSQGGKFKCE